MMALTMITKEITLEDANFFAIPPIDYTRFLVISLGTGMSLEDENYSATSILAKTEPAKNALLSDICISTSAAPTFLPAHHFETKDSRGNTRSFNLVDGGVCANNPHASAKKKFEVKIMVATYLI